MKGTVILIFFLLSFQPFFNFEEHHVFQEGNCKEIIATGNATYGNFTLLLKVRDPARQGYQVLCMVPAGYEYDYHHPWLGYKMHFVVKHKFIGTTTVSDTPPNIVKPGMMINDAGIAFTDADVLSYEVNPMPYAWDDFDWMRYAAQSADSLQEAVDLLEYAVKKLHATRVAENIFVADSRQAAIIEGDAVNFVVKFIKNGVAVQSNYPKQLWKKHIMYPLFVASDFSSNFTGWVRKNSVIRLGGFFGIKIVGIENESIIAKMHPFGLLQKIRIGEGKPVGYFWVKLLNVSHNKAKIFACYGYFMWEKLVTKEIMKDYGELDVKDMMRISRLHSRDLAGLRGICQGGYEAATIYKIPSDKRISCLWFAADQCSSIFVPVHICDEDIYDAYENGDAAMLSLHLLERYGHGNITSWCEKVEKEFINETIRNEKIAENLFHDGKYKEAITFLTASDIKMQIEAILIEKIWLNMSYLGKNFQNVSSCLDMFLRDMNFSSLENVISKISLLKVDEKEYRYIRNIIKNLDLLKFLIKEKDTSYKISSNFCADEQA